MTNENVTPNEVSNIVEAAANTIKVNEPVIAKAVSETASIATDAINVVKTEAESLGASAIKIILTALAIVGISYFALRSCKKIPTKATTVTQLNNATITAADKKILPGVIKKIIIPTSSAPLGYVDHQTILQSVSKTVVVDTKSLEFGVTNKLGMYIDCGPTGIGGGISYSPVQIYRFVFNALLGYPALGAGVSYQVFSNSYIGGAYTFNYRTLEEQPVAYISVNF